MAIDASIPLAGVQAPPSVALDIAGSRMKGAEAAKAAIDAQDMQRNLSAKQWFGKNMTNFVRSDGSFDLGKAAQESALAGFADKAPMLAHDWNASTQLGIQNAQSQAELNSFKIQQLQDAKKIAAVQLNNADPEDRPSLYQNQRDHFMKVLGPDVVTNKDFPELPEEGQDTAVNSWMKTNREAGMSPEEAARLHIAQNQQENANIDMRDKGYGEVQKIHDDELSQSRIASKAVTVSASLPAGAASFIQKYGAAKWLVNNPSYQPVQQAIDQYNARTSGTLSLNDPKETITKALQDDERYHNSQVGAANSRIKNILPKATVTPPPQAAVPGAQTVQMTSPSGKKVNVPADSVQKAKAAGYK